MRPLILTLLVIQSALAAGKGASFTTAQEVTNIVLALLPAPATNTVTLSNAFNPYTFRNQSRPQIDRLLFGRSDTNKNWLRFNGENLNPDCWIAPVDFSGVDTTARASLITARHAIVASHSPPPVDSELVFIDRQGIRHTNRVALLTSTSNDLCVATLDSDVPVTPFSLLPRNYTNWLENGTLAMVSNTAPVEAIWFRPNSGRVNVKMVHSELYLLSGWWLRVYQDTSWNAPVFTEGDPTAGDSGGPVFILVHGDPVLLFATYATPGPVGPFLSLDGHLDFLESICGPLKYVSLNRYSKP